MQAIKSPTGGWLAGTHILINPDPNASDREIHVNNYLLLPNGTVSFTLKYDGGPDIVTDAAVPVGDSNVDLEAGGNDRNLLLVVTGAGNVTGNIWYFMGKRDTAGHEWDTRNEEPA